jgi:hypothetical protein
MFRTSWAVGNADLEAGRRLHARGGAEAAGSRDTRAASTMSSPKAAPATMTRLRFTALSRRQVEKSLLAGRQQQLARSHQDEVLRQETRRVQPPRRGPDVLQPHDEAPVRRGFIDVGQPRRHLGRRVDR